MIDIHSHILPEVDDGPKSWDVSVAMCRMAAADGITHMVATPHANDRYHYDREYLKGVLAHLQQLVGDTIKLSLGCDFHLSYDNLQDAFSNPTRYVIEGSQYKGCVIQMTGSALTGFWGEHVRRVAQWLLERQSVHVLATDAHDTAKRVPVLSTARDAAAVICGEEVADALVEANPRAIVSAQPLPYFPRPVAGSYRKNSN